MITIHCDGCGTEIKQFDPHFRVGIESLGRSPRTVTLHACSTYCIRDAVGKSTAEAMTPDSR